MEMLPDSVSNQTDRLIADGERFADEEQDERALSCFQAAWELLLEPKEDQGLAESILASIGDSHFHLGHWEACYKTMQQLVKGWAGMLENPFIRLRLGQSLFEMGDLREAGNWMVPAYLLEGAKLFENEDPKYLAHLKANLDPPPDGWPEGW